ncbi:MAG: M23 family peptidase [Alphaproteobacteria bacterium]|nr:MAG: M23 family peptidase [Alphaproteobacteria bacterium]TAF14717.1 MAG: M23 family peptidase [Alphaproteobacteria bacterium]TAF38885.1 MAG: M23 family peptidase [Alphaproteobacteria bacterium]TAF75188.1 MAG: M23 family peptidase [Alphaproteobacteria bacterium]
MHLMSFYATPYSARHRQEKSVKKTLFLCAGSFLAGGALCFGLAFAWYAPSNLKDSARAAIGGIYATMTAPQEAENMPVADALAVAATQNALLTPSVAPEVEAAPVPEPWPRTIETKVSSGDTLISILTHYGIEQVAAHRLSKDVNRTYNLRQLRPGHKMTLVLNPDATRTPDQDSYPPTILYELKINIAKLKTVIIKRTGDNTYSVHVERRQLITEPKRAKAVIVSSLYRSASEHGVSDKTISDLIKNFSYDVDFQRDIKAGDVIDVMYESKRTEDGEVIETGNVLYAKLNTKGKEYIQYRYTNELGLPAYYNERGESIVKKFLRTPVDGARISSRFGMRHHPVLGYSKMHKGVDFAAPTGTPIFSAGDGMVVHAGRAGSYGNMVVIKHNGQYSTAYAHASRIARHIRVGTRVQQGQVIAYVGTTGRSTGPHLHYEIRKNGAQVNPLNVSFAGGDNVLSGRKLTLFKQHVEHIKSQLAVMSTDSNDQSSVALAE